VTTIMSLIRRDILKLSLGAAATLASSHPLYAAAARSDFADWVEHFRSRARARGISDATYNQVMGQVQPDTSVYDLDRNQPEFREEVWKYINRRVSDWRIMVGKERAAKYAALFERIEHDYGVDRFVILGLWGVESAFGEIITNPKYVRPVIPALAALAWGEPRRRVYWEQELLNALTIIEKGWSSPKEMVGSWAGAMGHTQWMPEVWLNMGIDYDSDGKISPFGPPDDALASSARYLQRRGKYRRDEVWGGEVDSASGKALADDPTKRKISAWQERGIKRADGRPLPPADMLAQLWQPVAGGPAFLIGQNFFAVRSYNPSSNYALALLHLGDRIRGEKPFVKPFPGGERALTIAEVQEMQKRLTALGYETEYTDGRTSADMLASIRTFQRKVGLNPADGYPGLQVLARLRQGP
jgi:membrane-bound lytic murein transglycosylase B